MKFHAFLRDDKEQAPRSCWNKFANVMSFLKAQGIRGLVGKNDWPRYTEEEPEIYEQEELDKLFAKCDEEERLWYEFFLMTGMREQEVMYTYWSDVNLAAATVRVSSQARQRMDTEGVQGARDSYSREAREQPKSVEARAQSRTVTWFFQPRGATRSSIFSTA